MAIIWMPFPEATWQKWGCHLIAASGNKETAIEMDGLGFEPATNQLEDRPIKLFWCI